MAMTGLYIGTQLPFETAQQREDSERLLVKMLAWTAEADLRYLQRNPETLFLYDSGVVYTEPDQVTKPKGVTPARKLELVKLVKKMGLEPDKAAMMLRIADGIEEFLTVDQLLKRGKGDCNELVPWRVAECWRVGIHASPYLVAGEPNERGGFTYHAVVWYPEEDEIECPSLILGMHGPEAAEERRHEIDKNVLRVQAYGNAAGFVPTSGVFKSPYKRVA